MKKTYIRQAKLPQGAYELDVAEVLGKFSNMSKQTTKFPKVFKSAFGGYYMNVEFKEKNKKLTQERLKEIYEEQNKLKEDAK